MKVEDIIADKEYKTTKVQIHAAKKKRKHNVTGDTNPHISNIDTHYGMTGPGQGAIIHR